MSYKRSSTGITCCNFTLGHKNERTQIFQFSHLFLMQNIAKVYTNRLKYFIIEVIDKS
jgi:hypothetical protein